MNCFKLPSSQVYFKPAFIFTCCVYSLLVKFTTLNPDLFSTILFTETLKLSSCHVYNFKPRFIFNCCVYRNICPMCHSLELVSSRPTFVIAALRHTQIYQTSSFQRRQQKTRQSFFQLIIAQTVSVSEVPLINREFSNAGYAS